MDNNSAPETPTSGTPTPAPTPAPTPTPTGQAPMNGLAIAALVTGIVAFLTGWAPFFGLLAGAAAVVLGILALRKAGGKGLSIAGIITGAIGALWSLIVTVLLIIGLASIGAAGGALNQAVEEANKEAQAQIDAKKDFGRGETARFGDFDVKVNSVERNFAGNSIFTPDEGKEYIVVNLTVTNKDDESSYTSSFDFKVNDNGSASSAALVSVDPSYESATLDPGASTTGNIVFEVTKDAQNLKLQYDAMVYTTGEGNKDVSYTLAL
jgi:hypothetical protein